VPQNPNLPDFFPESCCAMTCLDSRCTSRLPTVATNATALEQFRTLSQADSRACRYRRGEVQVSVTEPFAGPAV
jgi:hypothetical protein